MSVKSRKGIIALGFGFTRYYFPYLVYTRSTWRRVDTVRFIHQPLIEETAGVGSYGCLGTHAVCSSRVSANDCIGNKDFLFVL